MTSPLFLSCRIGTVFWLVVFTFYSVTANSHCACWDCCFRCIAVCCSLRSDSIGLHQCLLQMPWQRGSSCQLLRVQFIVGNRVMSRETNSASSDSIRPRVTRPSPLYDLFTAKKIRLTVCSRTGLTFSLRVLDLCVCVCVL